jgi:hypothetical protein
MARDLIVQAGVFAEHAFTSSQVLDEKSEVLELTGRWVHVHLDPGATLRLKLGMRRFVNAPSYDTPWQQSAGAIEPIRGRTESPPGRDI